MASVRVEHLWKQFTLQQDRADSVGQLLVRMLPSRSGRPRPRPFWALQDVSFEMPQGKSLGIIGSNGSGKSTMLKLLTRTMQPTLGKIAVRGRVSALIELGAGFHPDFSGRENIVLSGSILGFRRRDIEQRMDDIINFAEIRPFIDTPVKYYSSGMHARLGFSVAIHVEPDILIVDEVLAVGDEAFQQKCMERIFEMKRNGVGILLVSHDLGSIERLMDRAVWIEKGVLQADGTPHGVIHAYRSYLQQQQVPVAHDTRNEPAAGARDVVLTGHIAVAGRLTDVVRLGDEMDIVLQWANECGEVLRGHLVVSIRRLDGLEIARFSTVDDGRTVVLSPGRSSMTLHLGELRLAPGTYDVDACFESDQGGRLPEWRSLVKFRVQSAHRAGGLVVVPHSWEMVHGEAAGLPFVRES